MAFGSLSPVAIQQFFDNNGNPLAGGKLQLYLAGTTTPSPAYADVGLTTPLANPVILDAAGRAPELFLGALAYKQVLQNAGGVTIWSADNIVTPTALRNTSALSSATGTANDLPIPSGVITFLNFTNTAPVNVTGFAGGTPGQILIVRCGQTTSPVNLIHYTTSSAFGNRIYNFVSSGPTTLAAPGGTAMYIYYVIPSGEGLWILISHEQGAWLRIPYSAANFTAENPGPATWVVEAGDIKQMDYRLTGTSLLITIAVEASGITGAPIHVVINNFPYQFKTAINGLTAMAVNNGVYPTEVALMGMAASTSRILFARTSLAPWTATAGGMSLYAQVLLDVQ